MASVRHGKLVMAWDGEVKAGDAGRAWWAGFRDFPMPLGAAILLTEAVGRQAHFH